MMNDQEEVTNAAGSASGGRESGGRDSGEVEARRQVLRELQQGFAASIRNDPGLSDSGDEEPEGANQAPAPAEDERSCRQEQIGDSDWKEESCRSE